MIMCNRLEISEKLSEGLEYKSPKMFRKVDLTHKAHQTILLQNSSI